MQALDSAEEAKVQEMSLADPVHARMYPEYAAGNFAPNAHFILYFNRVNALISKESTVLDFGAGRGKFAEIERGWKLTLCSFKGRCAKVIGADVDPVVRRNAMTDENIVIGPDGMLDLPDQSVDLITAWAVLEHVTDPETTAAELTRVLKPGGWLCAWTPNRYGYVGLGARLVPNRLHARILGKIGVDQRKDEDVFPVVYKMNTRRALKRLFPEHRFEHHVTVRNGPPGYHAGKMLLARLVQVYGAIMPVPGRSMLHIYLRKKPLGT